MTDMEKYHFGERPKAPFLSPRLLQRWRAAG